MPKEKIMGKTKPPVRDLLFLCLVMPFILLFACGVETESESDTDGTIHTPDEVETYEEKIETYGEPYTIQGLWDALDTDADIHGSYILLQGILNSINDDTVILKDSTTSKMVESGSAGIDLTELKKVLDNNIDDEEDTITIGGVCYIYTDMTRYPYLNHCDYFYVNRDE